LHMVVGVSCWKASAPGPFGAQVGPSGRATVGVFLSAATPDQAPCEPRRFATSVGTAGGGRSRSPATGEAGERSEAGSHLKQRR
jgi:hypothetical protein